MRRSIRRALATLALLAVPAGGLSADCAQYITSKWGDVPASGTLVGTKTVTVSISGSGFGWTATYSESYTVGTYEMQDGSRIRMNCSNYTIMH